MKRIMIDIESLSLDSRALVLSLGAVEFSLAGLGPEFYHAMTGEEQAGRHISYHTAKWWIDQAAANPAAANLGAPQPPDFVLGALQEFIGTPLDGLEVWFNGPQFDAVAIATLCQDLGIVVPWRYNQVRDCRTLWSLVSKDVLDEGIDKIAFVDHHALDDAKYQALRTINALKALGVK